MAMQVRACEDLAAESSHGRVPTALQVVVEEPAPGLEPIVDPQHFHGATNSPLSLSVSRMATAAAVSLGYVDEPEVHAPDRRAVVVEEADGPRLGQPVGVELLAPLAQQPGQTGSTSSGWT